MLVSPTINSLHGRIRSITGTDPAAGAQISEVVPARRRWRITSIFFTLTTDVNEADRTVHLIIDDGTNTLLTIVSDTVQTASLTRGYIYSLQPVPQFLAGTSFHIPLPALDLPASFRFRTSIDNKEAGDDLSAPQLLVEEWIDP